MLSVIFDIVRLSVIMLDPIVPSVILLSVWQRFQAVLFFQFKILLFVLLPGAV
jgi:hypothetical protein